MTTPHDALQRLAWDFTEEQRLGRDAARAFAKTRLAPGAAERDRTGRFPLELVPELAGLGLFAMKVRAEDGGGGTDNVGYVLAMEAIAESCASTAVILASSNLASKILGDHGTDAQRERWLRPYAEGKLGPASFALTEPQGGSDAGSLATTATLEGDHYVLSGSKTWITSGAHAGIHIVFARTSREAGTRGISCFVVERGTPGLRVGPDEDKMGLRSSGTVALYFDECRVPRSAMIGAPGSGYPIALSALGAGRIGIAAQAIGIAESALRLGLAYAHERRAFGQRVSEFQNSQFVLANCRTDLDAAWLLTLRAAKLLDRGDAARAESSMAKVAATEACGRVVDAMVQIHGGYGYSREYEIERLYRDARVTRIYEGTNEIQRVVIAREMLRGMA
jgi:alkylation response protein AidB-like acyl-CoA dehydrogenase